MDQFDDHRFETFKMGNSSHSRNSLSVSTSIKSTNSLDLKRNSHHRRRSSVSTRHESAELMGVPVPELTPSPSRDSFNIGDKDSIRQKALWALEGKPDASYVKVEIPELSTAEIDTQLMFDFPTRPSFPPGTGAGFGQAMASKRDSFKMLGGTLASKDQLGTLVEEEEEDSDSENLPIAPTSTPREPMTPTTPDSQSLQTVLRRTRPANLSLRPLSLTPETLTTAISAGLPTPGSASSNSVKARPGLKSLSLLTNSLDDSTKPAMNTNNEAMSPPNPRRPTLNLQISSESLASSVTCVSSATPSSASDDGKSGKALRRSSISYKCSQATTNVAGLPTPEMTPTFSERRYSGHSASSLSSRSSLSSNPDLSIGSGEEEPVSSAPSFSRMPSRHRTLSASEQHFLFKSHNALLARITDLERALSVRGRESYGFSASPMDGGNSRPLSTNSDVSSNSEPLDEMLRLVADLKAERDELKRDVDGWRTRVGDLEKQIGVFVKRVDNERRDAWVARSRVGLLEVEKNGLMKDAEAKESVIAELSTLVRELEEQKRSLVEENEQLVALNERLNLDKGDLEGEVERWRRECDLLKTSDDESALATPTPTLTRSFESGKREFVFGPSRDSESSVTDVELEDDPFAPDFGFSLKGATEVGENQDDGEFSEEENGLAGYEDEDDGDMSFHGSSSSFGSLNDSPRSVAHLDVPNSPITPVTPPRRASDQFNPMQKAFQYPAPTHQSRASLSKTWTFPHGSQVKTQTNDMQESESVDKFFGCLDDLSSSKHTSLPLAPDNYTYDRGKDMFSNALKNVTDDDTPFFLPRGVGGIVTSESSSSSPLDVVVEEEEEDDGSDRLTAVDEEEDMFGDVGGIKITFTPPQDDISRDEEPSSPLSPSPSAHDKGDSMRSFTFGRPTAPSTSAMITPPKSVPRVPAPSAIPRAIVKVSPSSPETVVTPPKLHSPRFGASSPNTFVTPPSKRGGATQSFIPLPVTPPSPSNQLPGTPRATFIRQPQRRPLVATNGVVAQSQNSPNAEQSMNVRSSPRRSFGNPEFSQASRGTHMTSIDLRDNIIDSRSPPTTPKYHIQTPSSFSSPSSSSFTSFVTSPITSLQTFTNMIPLPWTSVSRPTEGPVDAYPISSCDQDTFVNQTHSTWSAHNASQRGPHLRGYVSKEAQLEKLKIRLSHEQIPSSKVNACKKCADDLVFL